MITRAGTRGMTMRGTITRAFLPKGFAFVRGDDEQDYFLQANELYDNPWEGAVVREGARVEFTPVSDGHGGNKLRATEAKVIKEVRANGW